VVIQDPAEFHQGNNVSAVPLHWLRNDHVGLHNKDSITTRSSKTITSLQMMQVCEIHLLAVVIRYRCECDEQPPIT
jgi:hypothetical protein